MGVQDQDIVHILKELLNEWNKKINTPVIPGQHDKYYIRDMPMGQWGNRIDCSILKAKPRVEFLLNRERNRELENAGMDNGILDKKHAERQWWLEITTTP